MDRWLIKHSKDNIISKDLEPGDVDSSTPISKPPSQNSATTDSERNKRQTPSSSHGQISKKKRKYDPQYLLYGFTITGDETAPDAICIICNAILANSSLAPAKLRRHFETNHSAYKGKDVSFFERKLEVFNKTKNLFVKKFKTDNENATEASYKASYQICLHGEAHTIGESLIKPIIKDVVSCILDEESVKKIDAMPLSNNTVSRRIKDIVDDIENELISRLHACAACSLQMDESTDAAGLAILLVFVRYNYDSRIEHNLLLCESLELHTTEKGIFYCIDDYMRKYHID